MKIKICGLTCPEDIQTANVLQVDYIGFVFAQSRRQVTAPQAAQLRGGLSPDIQAVGIFVRHPLEEMIALVEAGTIDVIQLHGGEGEDVVAALKGRCPTTPIIKAISVSGMEDVLAWQTTQADFLLLDNGVGGTGVPFDWGVLAGLEEIQKPYFIAGGLTPENVPQVLCYAPYGVDVSGGVESQGKKDGAKMRQFVDKVRSVTP